MKILKLLFISLLFISCSEEEELITPEPTLLPSISIVYDAPVNKISVDGSDWVDSIDLDSYVSSTEFEAGSSGWGVFISYSSETIRIISNEFILVSIETNEKFPSFELVDNGVLLVSVNDIEDDNGNLNSLFELVVNVSN